MPPFVRDDVPLVWFQEDLDQNQNQYAGEEVPLLEEDDFTAPTLEGALSEVRAPVVEQHAADVERTGQNMGTLHQRFSAYFNLIMEFTNAVERKMVLAQQPYTAEIAAEHSVINEQITRLVREISEFYDRYMRA